MERAAFLLEESGKRLSCLLNPESLVLRRRAGVRTRESLGGLVTGSNKADNPLLYTGGGCTTLELDLVFDISLAGSSVVSDDVRDLTGPIWELAENSHRDNSYGQPLQCLFVWGKNLSIPGVVTAAAERLECFSSSGVPGRAWLRLRLMRVSERTRTRFVHPTSRRQGSPGLLALGELSNDQEADHEVIGGGPVAGGGEFEVGERADQLAYRMTGDARNWRALMIKNGIDDPFKLRAGSVIKGLSHSDVGAAQ